MESATKRTSVSTEPSIALPMAYATWVARWSNRLTLEINKAGSGVRHPRLYALESIERLGAADNAEHCRDFPQALNEG